MIKYTPGPWVICELSDGTSKHIAVAHKEKVETGALGAVCLVSGVSCFTPEDAANARLICAAPEMYRLLRIMEVEAMPTDEGGGNLELWQEIRRVRAIADGEA